MFSRFWVRLGKVSLFLLVTYLLMAYIIVVSIIVREELSIVDASRVISALSPIGGSSTIEGQVRNVFGDPVPFGVIIVGEHLVQADNIGAFRVTGLSPGRFTMEIFAGGYEKYTKEIQVEEGVNYPTIKYEAGLWPQVFLVDFHVFYKDNDSIFGMIGFANGSTEPIYIERASIINPAGEVITDILHDNDGFTYYMDLSNKLEVVEQPQKALKWAPVWCKAENSPRSKGTSHRDLTAWRSTTPSRMGTN